MKKILVLLLVITVNISYSQKLTPELLWKFGRVSDPKISADGKTVLYNVRSYNVAENIGQSDIYSITTAGGTAVNITKSKEDESAARFRPDGKKIGFSCNDNNGITQLWEMNADGSERIQVTSYSSDISNFQYSPLGNMIWFTSDVKVDKTIQDLYPDLPKATGRIYDDLMYRHWNTWEDGAYSHVHIVNYADGKITGQVMDIQTGERFDTPLMPDGGEEQITWSPDGKYIAYTCKKLSGKEYAISTNSDIYLYEIASKKTSNLSDGILGYDVNPSFSPDGTKMIWLSMERPGNESDRNRIMQLNLKTNQKVELTKGFDYNVENADWSADGKMIYFICGINATEQLWSYDLNLKNKKPIRQITNDIGDHQAFTMVTVGKETTIITAMMSISMPTELFKVNLKEGISTQLTFTNKETLSTMKMGNVVKRMVKATDGKQILTWVIYPPDFDATKKYPTLLFCQGGPQSTVNQFFSYRWNFQLMAANGYIVVAPNRRGLPSFGTEWNDQITGDWGGQCMKDLLSSIDDVSKESYVNKDRLGAVGPSFGGYSVYWLAGHHEKRFKTFISHCGVFNLKSMYGSTEETFFNHNEAGGSYWQTPTPKTYEQFQPIDFVRNWDTPILVIHNEKDFRVPLNQGLEAFAAARLQNIPAKFLCFPDEGHWVLKPQNSILWQRVFFEWLDKYLKK